MSVFIIREETYAKVLASIPKFKSIYFPDVAYNNLKSYIQACYEANVKSYNQMYSEKIPVERLPDICVGAFDNKCQLLKALQCIYNNIETDNFDFTYLNYIIKDLQNSIISELPEYENAAWG